MIRQHVVRKVLDTAIGFSKLAKVEQIAPQVSLYRNEASPESDYLVNLPLIVESENDRELLSKYIYHLPVPTDNIIKSSKSENNTLLRLTVDTKELVKDTLDSNPTELTFTPDRRKVIVEFSSPNVAKPFHAGHLRSTIIGNFIANVKSKLGKDVVKINYLGDWGTQFGLLAIGVAKSGVSEEELAASPTNTLYSAYVWANKQAEVDSSVLDEARVEFQKLENGDEAAKRTWSKFIDLSKAELERTYSRLGVNFDEYQFESHFGRPEVDLVLQRLADQGILETDDIGRICARTRGKTAPLVKSDGSTLYLARDIAAAMHRQRKIAFNEMLYVVENGQSEHFRQLFSICQNLGLNESWNMRHVKFGLVRGMSTRRGNAVFLSDILDQARDLCFEKLKTTETTKVEPTLELADALGRAAVIINDLKQRRTKDYEFNWDRVLQMDGDTAIRLQYTHCRLHSLLSNSAVAVAKFCDPDAIAEPEAVALALLIASYEETVLKACTELEACALVSYLFRLTHAINKAFKVLPVKGSSCLIAEQRLLLFSQAKKVLSDGLRLLGIEPLEQM